MSKFTNGLKSSIPIKTVFYFLDIMLIHNDLRNVLLNFFYKLLSIKTVYKNIYNLNVL